MPAPELQSDIIAITGLAANLDRAKMGLLDRVKELQAEQEDRVSRTRPLPGLGLETAWFRACFRQPGVGLLSGSGGPAMENERQSLEFLLLPKSREIFGYISSYKQGGR